MVVKLWLLFWSLHLPNEKKRGHLFFLSSRWQTWHSNPSDVPFFLLRGWQFVVCPSALDSKPLSCRDDFFATALKDLVGWFGNHKSFPPSKEGKRFRSTGRTCRPRMHQRVRPPKNVEVPKFSSTDTQTKTKVADLCSVVFAFTIHNGHLRFIYPPFQTTHRFGYPSLSPNAAEKPRSFHMKTTSLLGAAGEESMNMRESWEGTPLATKVPSWMPKSEWTSVFFSQNFGWFSGLTTPPTSKKLQ